LVEKATAPVPWNAGRCAAAFGELVARVVGVVVGEVRRASSIPSDLVGIECTNGPSERQTTFGCRRTVFRTMEPLARDGRLAPVKLRLMTLAMIGLAACAPAASPGPTTTGPTGTLGTSPPVIFGTPEPTLAGGAEGLVADLVARGATARLGASFLAEPLQGEGVVVCVGAEALQVYVLKDHEAALAAASRIDRNDPSKIGTALVDWAGTPRFWLRDRILVLYLGTDVATDAVLRALLGSPFAEAHEAGRPPLPAPDCA
jgi:hypothetical protein